MTNIDEQLLYGEYNWNDPIYKILRRETASPRYKIFLMKQAILTETFYQYTDMLALETRSGVDLDELFRRQRRMLVDEDVIPEANKQAQTNFSHTQTPYKDLEQEDFRYNFLWCG